MQRIHQYLINTFGVHPAPTIGLLVGIAVFIIMRLIMFPIAIGVPDLDALRWKQPSETFNVGAREMTARLLWSAAILAQITALAVTISTSSRVMASSISDRASWARILVFSLPFMTGIAAFVLHHLVGASYEPGFPGQLIAIARQKCELPHLSLATDISNSVAVVAATFIALATGAVVAVRDVTQLRNTPAILATKLKNLQLLLYVSAFLVIVALLQINAEYRWPAALLDNSPDNAELVSDIALGVTVAAGAFFTFLLAAVHGPASWVAAHLAQSCLPDDLIQQPMTNQLKWLQSHDLVASTTDNFKRLAAILGPLFASGTFAKLIQLVLD